MPFSLSHCTVQFLENDDLDHRNVESSSNKMNIVHTAAVSPSSILESLPLNITNDFLQGRQFCFPNSPLLRSLDETEDHSNEENYHEHISMIPSCETPL